MSIFEDMKSRLQNAANLAEGGFALDNIAAVAAELERIEELGIDYMPYRFFPTMASGDDLTLAAANFGVERKAAMSATAVLTITGDVGTAIDSEIKAAAGDMIFVCSSGVIGSDGTVAVVAVCETAGAQGNVPIGAISEFVTAYAGLDSVANGAAASGGADEESDEDLIERVKVRWQNPSTGGNAGDYLRWALSVPGVSRARVFNPRAGNVNIYLVGSGNTTASSQLIARVAEYIEARRPVGANVAVQSATAVPVNVAITATLQDGYTAAVIKSALQAALGEYVAGISFRDDVVSYLRIADLLFVEGVSDVSAYTLNGGTTTLELEATQFPVLGTVTVNGN